MITAIDPKTALVLIDLQRGIVKSKKVHPTEGIVRNACGLAETFRSKGLPVFVINVSLNGADYWLRARRDSKRIPNNPAVLAIARFLTNIFGFSKIVKELNARSSDIYITKNTFNAFYNTSLHTELQKYNCTGIVLAGISTSVGVEGTARAAFELGYNISFATDAITDSIESAHINSMKNILPRLGEFGTTEEICAEINKNKQTVL